jgi:hypothetical protein
MCIKFTELENGDLRLSLIEEQKENLEEVVNNKNLSDFSKLLCATESYWANGWGVTFADQLHQLSEAPVIVEELTREDDGSITVHGKAWYQSDYMIRSAAETILDQGYIDFTYWNTFDGENFKSLYG